MHGGCYVLNPGEAALPEALFMAGFGHFKVIAVDYRMPPEAYFPAALDDGEPSPSVLSRIEKQFNYTRRNQRLRRQ